MFNGHVIVQGGIHQKLIKDGAKRPHIALLAVNGLGVCFRRHVRRRADIKDGKIFIGYNNLTVSEINDDGLIVRC